MHFKYEMIGKHFRQECIPVGCIPATRRPYWGGVPGLGVGVPGLGGYMVLGGYMALEGGVPGLGGMCT